MSTGAPHKMHDDTNLLAEGVLLRPCDDVVVVEGLLEDFRLDAHLLCEGLAALETLHQPTTAVVLAVPLDLLGGRTVEDETDGELRRSQQVQGK